MFLLNEVFSTKVTHVHKIILVEHSFLIISWTDND